MPPKESIAKVVAVYIIWIILSALAAIAAFQLNAGILALAAAVVRNDALRPSGWSSQSLVNIQRLAVLILGSLWLMLSLWLENRLQRARKERQLAAVSLHFGAGMALLIGVCYALLWLLA